MNVFNGASHWHNTANIFYFAEMYYVYETPLQGNPPHNSTYR